MTLHEILARLVLSWGILGSAAWLVSFWFAARMALALEFLRDQPASASSEGWPRLSVIVAACNEAATIQAAAQTLLSQDYPNLELVLVNDRSTDGTGAVVDRLVAKEERAVALHLTDLPADWLGKVHALARGAGIATGEWLLFTDADVHFAPGALRKAVAFARQRNLDYLTAAPDLHPGTFPFSVMAAAFGFQFLAGLRWTQRPASKMGVGVGAFNLTRASILAASEGFEWFRLEIADDAGLATVLKRAGARSALASGHGVISLAWYSSAREMIRGLEKNLFGLGAAYSYPRAILATLALWLYAGSPLVALLVPSPAAKLLGVLVFVSLGLCGLGISRRFDQSPWPAPLAPFGVLLMGWALLRSAFLAWRRGGIVWRGTRYDLATLRAGRRIGLP